VAVGLERWRTEPRQRSAREQHCPAGLRSADERETVYPDTIVPNSGDELIWYHRNQASCWGATLEKQDMANWIGEGSDPLVNRTFGGMIRGTGLVRDGAAGLRTRSPRQQVEFSVHAHTARADTPDGWLGQLAARAAAGDAVDAATAYSEHAAWWRSFWSRSWIHVSGTAEAETGSRGYALQRFMNACAGRGAYPIKFNGSIFAVDGVDTRGRNRLEYLPVDADYRRWGGGYWFQNTRLTYWSMITSGDFDLMEPWVKMYLDALPLAMARARHCFGIEGAACFPETMTFWGTFLNENYGYHRRADLAPGLSENKFIRRYWQGMIELVALLLDTYAVSRDDKQTTPPTFEEANS
jgi:alpha-L-fucosidase 2